MLGSIHTKTRIVIEKKRRTHLVNGGDSSTFLGLGNLSTENGSDTSDSSDSISDKETANNNYFEKLGHSTRIVEEIEGHLTHSNVGGAGHQRTTNNSPNTSKGNGPATTEPITSKTDGSTAKPGWGSS